jgi:anti-repressor protein
MNEIIKISDYNGNKAVSARDLYNFLEVTTDFTTWCKRMFEYGFTIDFDYTLLIFDEPENQLFPNPNPKQDYVLSMDCAKEISMIQRTDKGKEARQYFIAMEKLALQPRELSRKELALMIIESENARELAENKVKELEPKAEVYEQIANADNLSTMNDSAKILGWGRNNLIKHLKSINVFMSTGKPYQKYIDQGYFDVKVKPIKMGNYSNDYSQTFVTGKGLTWLTKLLN